MTANTTKLTVTIREPKRETLTHLRAQSLVPANLYGLGQPSQALSVEAKDAIAQLGHDEGGLIYLVFADKSEVPALIDEVQRHPVTQSIQHLVFRRVNLKVAVISEVEIKLVGKVDVPNATVVTVVDAVEIESLPANIPDEISVDISGLTEIGQSITFAQLVLPAETKLVIEENRLQEPVVLLQEVKEEVEAEVTPETTSGEEAPAGGAPSAEADQAEATN